MTEFERARATGAPSAFSTTTTPTLPPRPGGGAYGGGSVLGSGGYGGGGYGASAYGGGGYGGGYGTSSSYGGGYGGYGASRYGGGYGTSSYGGGYGSGYGASRYGSRYGGGAGYGYGGAYGGYGGGYGGGGYSRGGALGAGPRGPGEGGPGVVTWIDQFSQVVDTFGRFAHLLDMNCDALYGSFSSVLRLFESMSELRRELLFIFQTVTLYRLLKSVLERFGSVGKFLTGTALHSTTTTASSTSSTSLSSSAAGLDLDSFQQFQGKDRTAPRGRRLWPFLLFLVSAVGGPLLINRLWRMLRASAAAAAQQEQEQEPALQPLGERETPVLVQALYDFVGSGSEGDLQFSKGAVIRVVRADPDQGWWEGEMDGRVGLFPANFVQAVSRPSDSGSDVVGGAWRPVGSGLRDSEPIRLHLGADSPQPTRFT